MGTVIESHRARNWSSKILHFSGVFFEKRYYYDRNKDDKTVGRASGIREVKNVTTKALLETPKGRW